MFMCTFTTYFLLYCELSDHVLRSSLHCLKCMYMHECMPYIIIIEYQYYTFFLDMSQPSVACLNSLRSAGVGIVGIRSAGVGIAGVRSAGIGRRSREARRRRASMLVGYIMELRHSVFLGPFRILRGVPYS